MSNYDHFTISSQNLLFKGTSVSLHWLRMGNFKDSLGKFAMFSKLEVKCHQFIFGANISNIRRKYFQCSVGFFWDWIYLPDFCSPNERSWCRLLFEFNKTPLGSLSRDTWDDDTEDTWEYKCPHSEKRNYINPTPRIRDSTCCCSSVTKKDTCYGVREGFKNPRHGNFPLGGYPPPRPRGLHGRDFSEKLAEKS